MPDKTVPYRPLPGVELSITGDATDAGVIGHLVRTGGRYADDLCAFLGQVVPADGVVVDVGANIGALSSLAARLAPRGRVHAFEPAPQSAEYARRNAAANGLANLSVEQVALSDREGEVAFAANPDYPAGAHLGDGDGAVLVRSTTLDAWARDAGLARLDLVKIDVEGAEPMVLVGARATVARLRPTLVVECNVAALRRVAGASFADLYRTVHELCGAVGVLDDDGAVIALTGESHLERRLGHRGVVDVVGLPHGMPPRARLRGLLDDARLRRAHSSRRPAMNFVVTPTIDVRPTGPVSARAGEVATVGVEVRNRSPWWLSSEFPWEPVHLAYRWRGAGGDVVVPDGRRTRFPRPVGPGETVRLAAEVEMPATAGSYRLELTLVQERWAWLDQIDPSCRAEIAVEIP